MLEYEHCHINWFTLITLLETTGRNNDYIKPMAQVSK